MNSLAVSMEQSESENTHSLFCDMQIFQPFFLNLREIGRYSRKCPGLSHRLSSSAQLICTGHHLSRSSPLLIFFLTRSSPIWSFGRSITSVVPSGPSLYFWIFTNACMSIRLLNSREARCQHFLECPVSYLLVLVLEGSAAVSTGLSTSHTRSTVWIQYC